jgi:hypothetical protein
MHQSHFNCTDINDAQNSERIIWLRIRLKMAGLVSTEQHDGQLWKRIWMNHVRDNTQKTVFYSWCRASALKSCGLFWPKGTFLAYRLIEFPSICADMSQTPQGPENGTMQGCPNARSFICAARWAAHTNITNFTLTFWISQISGFSYLPLWSPWVTTFL